MIQYIPIESCVAWTNLYNCDLCSFDWQTNTARFLSEDEDQIVAITFGSNDVIVRMLDEFALSTESDPDEWSGIIPNHFAYQVVGDPFLEAQSEIWRDTAENSTGATGTAKHYRFMTGCGCLDVISTTVPQFTILGAYSTYKRTLGP